MLHNDSILILENMINPDLSTYHHPIGDLLRLPMKPEDWEMYRLSTEQVAFFHEYGYIAGVRLLNEAQVEQLRAELAQLMDPAHPQHELFYEFHSNESVDPTRVLFHALGAWRIAPGFHDLLWHPQLQCGQWIGTIDLQFRASCRPTNRPRAWVPSP